MEGLSVKRVVLLGLKDREGNLYTCRSFVNGWMDEFTMIPQDKKLWYSAKSEVFPYAQFRACSNYDQDKFEFTFLDAELDINDEQYDSLDSFGVWNHMFEYKDIRVLKELENPWEYAQKELHRLTDADLRDRVLENLMTHLPKLRFRSQKEFNIFLSMWNKKEFCVTRFNLEYLPEILKISTAKINTTDYNNKRTIFYGEPKDLETVIEKSKIPA